MLAAMLLRRLSLACALVASALPLHAGGGVPDDLIRAEVLRGWTTDRGTRMTALRLDLAPGWKTYWRAPGDAGIPPDFDWSGSRNLGAVALHWPAPDIFDSYGVRTIGYADELVLPIELTPREPGAPIRLSARLSLGVCETVCVPAELTFHATLDGPGRSDPAIHAALAARPVSAARAGVGTVDCALEPIADGLRLTARIAVPPLGGAEVALVETADRSVWVSEPSAERRGDALTVTADLVAAQGAPLLLDRSGLRFTLLGQGRAVDVQGCR
jgi:DsbC/DsbD-like thiol-disulfide interchange protein